MVTVGGITRGVEAENLEHDGLAMMWYIVVLCVRERDDEEEEESEERCLRWADRRVFNGVVGG